MRKKGQVFSQMSALAIGIATFAIMIIVALMITSEGQDQVEATDPCDASNATWNGTLCCTGSADEGAGGDNCAAANQSETNAAYNATQTLAKAQDDIPSWIPIVIITAIGAILIGMVGAFRGR